MALPILGALGLAGSLFGGGNDKDANRNKTSLDLYNQAMSGSVAAEVHLRVLAGINEPRAVAYGIAGGGWATAAAQSYARTLVGRIDAARAATKVGGALGTIGTQLIQGAGLATPPPAAPPGSAAAAAANQVDNEWVNWAWPLAVGVIVLVLLPKIAAK